LFAPAPAAEADLTSGCNRRRRPRAVARPAGCRGGPPVASGASATADRPQRKRFVRHRAGRSASRRAGPTPPRTRWHTLSRPLQQLAQKC